MTCWFLAIALHRKLAPLRDGEESSCFRAGACGWVSSSVMLGKVEVKDCGFAFGLAFAIVFALASCASALALSFLLRLYLVFVFSLMRFSKHLQPFFA